MKLCPFHDQYKCCRHGSGSGGHPLRFPASVSQTDHKMEPETYRQWEK